MNNIIYFGGYSQNLCCIIHRFINRFMSLINKICNIVYSQHNNAVCTILYPQVFLPVFDFSDALWLSHTRPRLLHPSPSPRDPHKRKKRGFPQHKKNYHQIFFFLRLKFIEFIVISELCLVFWDLAFVSEIYICWIYIFNLCEIVTGLMGDERSVGDSHPHNPAQLTKSHNIFNKCISQKQMPNPNTQDTTQKFQKYQ